MPQIISPTKVLSYMFTQADNHSTEKNCLEVSSISVSEIMFQSPILNDVNKELDSETISSVPITRLPHFLVFDLDGTLISESFPVTLLPFVREILLRLKSSGHFLSVCSNNVMAKSILNSFGLLEIFDIVIGFPSTSYKALEILEIFKYYRFLLRTHQISTKLRTSRVIFVDNDEENTSCIAQLNAGCRVCNDVRSSLLMLKTGKEDLCTSNLKSVQIALLEKELCRQYHLKELPSPVVRKLSSENSSVLVHLSANAKNSSNQYGTEHMKFHNKSSCGALRRCKATITVPLAEATKFGHTFCKICCYNLQEIETNVYCTN